MAVPWEFLAEFFGLSKQLNLSWRFELSCENDTSKLCKAMLQSLDRLNKVGRPEIYLLMTNEALTICELHICKCCLREEPVWVGRCSSPIRVVCKNDHRMRRTNLYHLDGGAFRLPRAFSARCWLEGQNQSKIGMVNALVYNRSNPYMAGTHSAVIIIS